MMFQAFLSDVSPAGVSEGEAAGILYQTWMGNNRSFIRDGDSSTL